MPFLAQGAAAGKVNTGPEILKSKALTPRPSLQSWPSGSRLKSA